MIKDRINGFLMKENSFKIRRMGPELRSIVMVINTKVSLWMTLKMVSDS